MFHCSDIDTDISFFFLVWLVRKEILFSCMSSFAPINDDLFEITSTQEFCYFSNDERKKVVAAARIESFVGDVTTLKTDDSTRWIGEPVSIQSA